VKRGTAQELAEVWRARSSAAVEDYKKGVNAVDTAPGMLAAAQKEKYVRRVQERADKWADKVSAVTLQAWKQVTVNKGGNRIAEGVRLGVPKFQAFIGEFMQFQRSTVAPAMASMPKNTLEDGIARAVFVIRANAEFGRGRRGIGQGPFGFPVPQF
jgi:hypothetical protein